MTAASVVIINRLTKKVSGEQYVLRISCTDIETLLKLKEDICKLCILKGIRRKNIEGHFERNQQVYEGYINSLKR